MNKSDKLSIGSVKRFLNYCKEVYTNQYKGC